MKKVSYRKVIFTTICILIFLIAIAGCELISCMNKTPKKALSNNQVEAQNPNLISKSDDQYFELVGFGQLQIDSDDRYINLINPPENTVYLSFGVIYNDRILYKTDLIEPGKMEQYDVYSCLDAGEQTIYYSIDVYDLVEQKLLWTGIQQEQKLVIKK